MLKKMSKSRTVRLFILGTHMVGQVDGHDRGTVVPVENDMEPVIKIKKLEVLVLQDVLVFIL